MKYVIMILGLFVLSGCSLLGIVGSGKVITKEVEVVDFNKILLSGLGNLIIEQGDAESLTIEAEDNIMELIVVEVENGTLDIDYVSYTWPFGAPRPTRDVNFYISVRDLNEIKIAGSGSVKSEGIKTDDLDISVSGSGKVDLAVEAEKVSSKIAGSGNFTIRGEVASHDINISGSGKFFTKDLKTEATTVKIAGSGQAEVYATDELDVDISGSGKVYYLGNPRLTQSISGSGRIEQLAGGEDETAEENLNSFDYTQDRPVQDDGEDLSSIDDCIEANVYQDVFDVDSFMCCEGLKKVSAIPVDENCQVVIPENSPGVEPGWVCIDCGDNYCNPEYENNCNCPEDC